MIARKSAFPRRPQSSDPASQKATPTEQTSNSQDGRREGERRKRRTLTALEARREWFVLRGRRVLLRRALADGSATVDDVRDAVTLPVDIDPKCFGSVPTALAFAGIIRADGFLKTSRPTAHARPVTIWRLVDRDAAERWLIDHPEDSDARPSEPAPSSHVSPAVVRDRPAEQQSLFDERGEA